MRLQAAALLTPTGGRRAVGRRRRRRLRSGTVCGLVVITPASGYVDHTGAFMMALISTPVVYFGLQLKERVGYDDALDAFGVHGVGGLCGGLLTGFFANDFISGSPEKRGVFYGKGDQIWIQASRGPRILGSSLDIRFVGVGRGCIFSSIVCAAGGAG